MFDQPTIEFSYKNDDLHDPLLNAYHAAGTEAGYLGGDRADQEVCLRRQRDLLKDFLELNAA